MANQTIEILVEGGKATPGPPLGPAIGPLGINMMQVVEEINKKTADFSGMKVPVKITADMETKEFEIFKGSTYEVIEEQSGSHEPGTEVAADFTVEQAFKVARMKFDDLLANDYKHATKEVVGTCVSMGINVEGKDGRETQKDIDNGDYDEVFAQ